MKSGTTVWVNDLGAGIYMYPHNKVGNKQKYSVYIKSEKDIFHLPLSSIQIHHSKCWRCTSDVHINSDDHSTCPKCHWIICPNCGACRKPYCQDDKFYILDASDSDGWKDTTGYELYEFFNEEINKEFLSLGKDDVNMGEQVYKLLKDNFLYPIIVYDKGLISLYIELNFYNMANNIINKAYQQL